MFLKSLAPTRGASKRVSAVAALGLLGVLLVSGCGAKNLGLGSDGSEIEEGQAGEADEDTPSHVMAGDSETEPEPEGDATPPAAMGAGDEDETGTPVNPTPSVAMDPALATDEPQPVQPPMLATPSMDPDAGAGTPVPVPGMPSSSVMVPPSNTTEMNPTTPATPSGMAVTPAVPSMVVAPGMPSVSVVPTVPSAGMAQTPAMPTTTAVASGTLVQDTMPYCGDAQVQEGEECDPGDFDSSQGSNCSSDCTYIVQDDAGAGDAGE
jgi:cysteine-rich repeat protein